jgi:hypothetical protein
MAHAGGLPDVSVSAGPILAGYVEYDSVLGTQCTDSLATVVFTFDRTSGAGAISTTGKCGHVSVVFAPGSCAVDPDYGGDWHCSTGGLTPFDALLITHSTLRKVYAGGYDAAFGLWIINNVVVAGVN